jgi:RNA polymerase sigma-54 factor
MAEFNLNVGFRNEANVSQELRLAPQLLQWLNILQASSTDLTAMIRSELESNPALEVDGPMPDSMASSSTDEPAPPEEPRQDFDGERDERWEHLAELDGEWREDAAGRLNAGNESDEQEYRDHVNESITRQTSLQEHLEAQLRLVDDPALDSDLCGLLIGSLDERGYLASPLAELATIAGVSESRLEQALGVVQGMDPAGVGARDLRECLLLQLRGAQAGELVQTLVSEHLQAVARRQYRDLAALLGAHEEDVREAVTTIQSLNPAPGARFARHTAEYVQPDAVVSRNGNGYVVDLTDQRIPRLRLSVSVRRLLEQENLSREELAYIRSKIRAATFLIQGISQRQDTLKKTVEQIVHFQGDFFSQPAGQLNALTMANVAHLVGVHETTISRAIANKYLKTPRGLFPMRHFFQAGFRCADGSRMTPQKVKDLLISIIKAEDPCTPIMDRDIVLAMGKHGLRVARRTVAKYREELGIPASKDRQRKRARAVAAPDQPRSGNGSSAECAA